MKIIPNFYINGYYYFLSNFFVSPIEFMGVIYPTNEHFYQAAKCKNAETAQKIINTPDPGKCKKKGRVAALIPGWDELKIDVMRLGLKLKFSQNLDLRDLLIETEDAILEEGNYRNDTFWGVNEQTRKGKNMLGKLLMELREELKKE